jgi:hypothetical protein
LPWRWPGRTAASGRLLRQTSSHPLAGHGPEAAAFSAEVSQDISWLLAQGRHGIKARLPEKMDYLWRSCSGELSEQNDLFRLTYALETAKDMLWNYRLLNDREWAGRYAVTLNAGVNGIYLSRTHLDAAFDDNGRQINPLLTRLTGNVADLMPLFSRCGWLAAPEGIPPCPTCLR